jgi:general secretion pathway protein K
MVLGVTRELFSRLKEIMTVYSGQARIDPATASREVLLAIPGIDPGQVDNFIEARAASLAAAMPVPTHLLGGVENYLANVPNAVYRIVAEGHSPGAVVSRKAAVVRLIRNRQQPYSILAWFDEAEPIVYPAPLEEDFE